jgi:hypothetical protein
MHAIGAPRHAISILRESVVASDRLEVNDRSLCLRFRSVEFVDSVSLELGDSLDAPDVMLRTGAFS